MIKTEPVLLKLLSSDTCHFATIKESKFFIYEGEFFYYSKYTTLHPKIRKRFKNGCTQNCTVIDYNEIMNNFSMALKYINLKSPTNE